IAKQLIDKIYEKRKAAALDLEKQIRDCHQAGDQRRISQIIDQLVEMFSNNVNPLHIRNGGLIGLAGTAIALGVDIAPYMEKFIDPLLDCFVDPENRIRYFSAECLYNIAKVSKGEVLVYFNQIFDALSKLAADSELSVKNGAELLDRLLKDIVAESASVYIPLYPETEKVRDERKDPRGVLVSYPDGIVDQDHLGGKKAFSLAHFIPLLRERIYVVSPFTRSYLVSWINVLDSVPELELISYLPEFFDGLLKYLSDPTEDVRVATETILADFLREIRDVSIVRRQLDEQAKGQTPAESLRHIDVGEKEKLPELTLETSEKVAFINDNEQASFDGESLSKDDNASAATDDRNIGAWIPGQGVKVDYAAIVEILIQQLIGEHDEIQQSTALKWLAEFLIFTPDVMVPFTPRFVPAILPNLAHHVTMIQHAAIRTNKLLYGVIQNLPSPIEVSRPPTTEKPIPRMMRSPTPSAAKQSTVSSQEAVRPHSPVSFTSQNASNNMAASNTLSSPEEADLFDYQATVNELTIQFLSEFEETRILAMDDGTFPALLKTLSDSSEEVIKHDLQLLAQISSSSEENYFKAFMMNLLELFSTDRRLLETRGSLIIRQLCLNLNTEKIYRTFAEILEKEDDLEFASVMVQKLNIILITSPELADFRKRLKSLETRQDGQALFTTLYRSWCHNAVAVFSLCLLAQAYEHASNLLYIFADLEITVQMLVQVDKLVQLIESPVFTYIRLQLLEPERYPHLFKCLYGLLMLLPQSSAFISLRNRLNAVNSAGFLHIAPKPAPGPLSTRSKLAREEIKWQDLLLHFRTVQAKHEKARRQAMGTDTTSYSDFLDHEKQEGSGSQAVERVDRPPTVGRAPLRRRVTGETPLNPNMTPIAGRGGALSPLNPRARVGALLMNGTATVQKQRRTTSSSRQ
ncbi:VAC14 like protein, partial [Termitomyces sp. J132]